MRIDDLNRNPATQTTEQAGQAGLARLSGKDSAGQKAANDTAAGGTDQAEVSQLAQSLAAPAADRLDQLRLEVQSGKYEVAAQAVANAIIEGHLKG